jgi:BlaI family penicillinase repressor
MKVIWESPGALTAGEVVQRLEAGTQWKPRTIKTLLARLVAKGAVKAEASPGAARTFLYRAAVRREACARQESRSFLSRVFDGDIAPALLHFLQSANLSKDEINQLRRILDQEGKERGSGGGSAGGGKEQKS